MMTKEVQDSYALWRARAVEDPDLVRELGDVEGRDEEAIVAGFGSVEDAACKIWEDYAAPPIKARSSGMRWWSGWAAISADFTVPPPWRGRTCPAS